MKTFAERNLMSQPGTDLIAWLEQQWDKAAKDSENPDKELLEKYTFYDGLTTAYEFTIARVKQYGVQPTTDSRTAALMEIIDYADKKKKELRYNRIIRNLTSPDESPSPDEQGGHNSYGDIIHICEKLLEEDESC
jgi:hypothetical protein